MRDANNGDSPHQDRLLPGEDPDTRSPSQAARWLRTYDDLLRAKDQMIASLRGSVEESTIDAQLELTRYDGAMLAEQQGRFLRRQSFWRSRLEKLRAEP